jgi:hypothetical protein
LDLFDMQQVHGSPLAVSCMRTQCCASRLCTQTVSLLSKLAPLQSLTPVAASGIAEHHWLLLRLCVPAGSRDGASEGVLLQLTPVDAWQLGLGLCGFMMYKIAVLGVSLVPVQQGKVQEPAQQLEKNA